MVPAEATLDNTLKEHYRKLITEPIDLNIIRERLLNGTTPSPQEFNKEILLCFSNAERFKKMFICLKYHCVCI